MINRIHFLNTFTVNGLGGNPTAVYFSHHNIGATGMQMLAKEISVPVTAFVWNEISDYRIHYFTQQCEITACGHATLGASSVVAEIMGEKTINFRTSKGVKITSSVNGNEVVMKYASRLLSPATVALPMLEGLGLNKSVLLEVYRYTDTLVIVLNDESALHQLSPDIQRLKNSSNIFEEVVVTAASTNGYDYLLRSFCPWIGIDEDPVTGSVQAALGPYWARILNKTTLKAFQASSRGGEIIVSTGLKHVEIAGQTTFLSGLK